MSDYLSKHWLHLAAGIAFALLQVWCAYFHCICLFNAFYFFNPSFSNEMYGLLLLLNWPMLPVLMFSDPVPMPFWYAGMASVVLIGFYLGYSAISFFRGVPEQKKKQKWTALVAVLDLVAKAVCISTLLMFTEESLPDILRNSLSPSSLVQFVFFRQ